MSLHRVVHKCMLGIFADLYIPVPYSHPIEGKLEALKWMFERGLQAECQVIPECRFIALNGGLPKGSKND